MFNGKSVCYRSFDIGCVHWHVVVELDLIRCRHSEFRFVMAMYVIITHANAELMITCRCADIAFG